MNLRSRQKRGPYADGRSSLLFSFEAHIGIDSFDNESDFNSTALDRAGDDILDGRDNGALDELFRDDGLDTLLGDSGGELIQDGAVALG